MKRVFHANDHAGLSRLQPVLDGFSLQTAVSFSQAIEIISVSKFDLILTGVHFDDSRGVEFLKKVRETKRHKRTPFVFIRTRPSVIREQLRKTINALDKVLDVTGYIETDLLEEDSEKIRAAILSAVSGRR